MGKESISEQRRSNKAVLLCYVIMDSILVVSYLIELIKGSRTLGYFTIFSMFALVPLAIVLYLYSKDKEHPNIRYVVAGGYSIFYLFVIFTTVSQVAYVYAMLLSLMLLVYNELRLTISFVTIMTIGNIINVAVLVFRGEITKEDLVNIEIRVASVILFSVYMGIATKVMMQNNKAKMDVITEEKENTARLMEQLMAVSTKITDSIEVVSGRMESLQDSTMKTMASMQEVTQGTNDTAMSIQTQMEKTEDIQKTIHSVRDTSEEIEKYIDNTRHELDKAQQNMERLMEHVNISNQESLNVSTELSALGEYANQMQSIIYMIDEITSQTSLLSLNASIEAARAGEAGKGFAVVATEISNLATQTQGATESITTLIGNVSDELNKVFEVIEGLIDNINQQNAVVSTTAQSFQAITNSEQNVYKEASYLKELVQELTDANNSIVEGIETISASTEEVTAHSNETYECSSENSDIVNEVGVIIEDLNRMAQNLAGHA